MKIKVLQFTDDPGPRSIEDGPNSGEKFRKEYLEPAYHRACEVDEVLVVDLDGTSGYASSFLEEAFGGLVRDIGDPHPVRNKIEIKSDDRPWYVNEVREYIREGNKA